MTAVAFSNPSPIAPGLGYSHAALITGEGCRLLISGQVGRAPDGTVPSNGETQIALALANLHAVLKAHGMEPHSVVRTTLYITDRSLLAPLRAARAAFFGKHAPTSTLLIVAGLADPNFLVEIEAEAVA